MAAEERQRQENAEAKIAELEAKLAARTAPSDDSMVAYGRAAEVFSCAKLDEVFVGLAETRDGSAERAGPVTVTSSSSIRAACSSSTPRVVTLCAASSRT